MEFSEVYKQVAERNIAEEASSIFKAACMILWSISNETWNIKRCAWASGYTKREVETVFSNLRKNNILDDANIINADLFNEETVLVEFVLIAMVGAGEMIRIEKT